MAPRTKSMKARTISASRYEELKRRMDTYEAERKRLFPGSNWVDAERAKMLPKDVTNHERSLIEVYEWIHNPPDRYFLYIKDGDIKTRHPGLIPIEGGGGYRRPTATTWMGDVLGSVSFGREHGSIFGDTRVPVTVYGTNGIIYTGTYYKSTGDYARVKAVKPLATAQRYALERDVIAFEMMLEAVNHRYKKVQTHQGVKFKSLMPDWIQKNGDDELGYVEWDRGYRSIIFRYGGPGSYSGSYFKSMAFQVQGRRALASPQHMAGFRADNPDYDMMLARMKKSWARKRKRLKAFETSTIPGQ